MQKTVRVGSHIMTWEGICRSLVGRNVTYTVLPGANSQFLRDVQHEVSTFVEATFDGVRTIKNNHHIEPAADRKERLLWLYQHEYRDR